MRRRLLTVLALLCLLISLLATAAGLRSFFAGDGLAYTSWNEAARRSREVQLYADNGYLGLAIWRTFAAPADDLSSARARTGWSTFNARPGAPRRFSLAESLWPWVTLYHHRFASSIAAAGLTGPADVLSLRLRLWPLALATAIPAALFARSTLRTRRRLARGLCPACGYDLRATPTRCPECGTAPSASAPPN